MLGDRDLGEHAVDEWRLIANQRCVANFRAPLGKDGFRLVGTSRASIYGRDVEVVAVGIGVRVERRRRERRVEALHRARRLIGRRRVRERERDRIPDRRPAATQYVHDRFQRDKVAPHVANPAVHQRQVGRRTQSQRLGERIAVRCERIVDALRAFEIAGRRVVCDLLAHRPAARRR